MKKNIFGKMALLLLFIGIVFSTNLVKSSVSSTEAKIVLNPSVSGGGSTEIDNSPKITFFAHGLGGKARDWSNDYDGKSFDSDTVKFEYDPNSIFEKIRNNYYEKNGEKMKFYIYVDCTYSGELLFNKKGIYEANVDSSTKKYTYTYTSINNLNTISFSKHTIFAIQYDSWSYNVSTKEHVLEDACNDYIECINKVLNAYASGHSGVKPKINLVGHSLGGLVNLSYTIANPDRVSSLISLGTPYNGSTLDNEFVASIGIDDFKKYPCMCGKCSHSYYMCNLESRKNEWNKVYKTHKDIKFVAMSGNTSWDLIEWMIMTGDLGQGAYENSKEWAAYFLDGLCATPLLAGAFMETQGCNTDFCVDVDSQRAKGYEGVIHFDKTFYWLNSNVNKHSQVGPSFPHNLEAYDEHMHAIMMSVLDYGVAKTEKPFKENKIAISLIAKVSDSWIIKLVNNTGRDREFFYNSKMCSEGDADDWRGLEDICSTGIVSNGNYTFLIIEENGTATDITISYEDEYGERQVVCADKLSKDSLTLRTRSQHFKFNNYNGYDLNIKILGKNDDVWRIRITNIGSLARLVYYNKKMCFLEDAEKWNGLEDVSDGFELEKNAFIDIFIEENVFAGSIAISYLLDDYRYIFYGNGLKSDSFMNAKTNCFNISNPPSSCIAEKTLITLADGTQKKVKDLRGDESLLVWNLETGAYDTASILFIDQDPREKYEVISLFFSDGTKVEVISEHGFFDIDLNKYVYLDKNAEEYIGHRFFKHNNGTQKIVTLKKVKINKKTVTPYSPVTYGHLCYFVDGMLSMPGGIFGLFNYFDINMNTMMYDQEKKAQDIETYGLFSYEELKEIMPNLTTEMFDAVDGKYLKVAIGKGIFTIEKLEMLIERYKGFFDQ